MRLSPPAITSRISQTAAHLLPSWMPRVLLLAVLLGLAVGLAIGRNFILAAPPITASSGAPAIAP
ncbi:MAG TPA: hypothetical protein VE869_07720 [Gemmatimonas sp.]|nr:hypothetical protein [Gemmatimonas sp.]